MIIVIIALFLIFLILFTFGQIAIEIYERILKKKENNNVVEVFLIGAVFVTLLLSVTSFFLAINNYVFFSFFLVSIIYNVFNFSKLKSFFVFDYNIERNKEFFFLIFLAFISIFLVILYPLLAPSTLDSATYHIPSITWVENYKLTPGIANLEERIGFNSNYILISALFTFRFLTGEGLYLINIVVVILILCWLFREVIASRFEINRLTILIIYQVLLWTQPLYLYSTWTDTLPNVIIFYLIAKAILYPNMQEAKIFFHLSIGVILMTLKMSFAIMGIGLVFYFFISFIKKKESKSILFFSIYGILLIGVWLARNVVISGYLIFPIYQVDLFDVDWKVPLKVAMAEQEFINVSGGFMPILGLHYNATTALQLFPFVTNWLYDLSAYFSLWIVAFTFPLGIFFFAKKKEKNYFIITIFFVSILNVLYWLYSAPYFRFIGGLIFSINIFFFFMVFDLLKIKNIKKIFFNCLLLLSTLLLLNRTNKYLDLYLLNKEDINYVYKPKTLSEKLHFDIYSITITPLKLNDYVTIKLLDTYFIADHVPAVTSRQIDEGHFQTYKAVEARGNNITDGFKYNMDKE